MSNITTSPLTKSQGEALVALITSMRRDWDAAGVIVAVRAATAKGSALDVIRASVEAAAIATNVTPAIIPMTGPHWSATTSGHIPSRVEERCPKEFHTGTAWNCPQCRSEQIAVDVDNGERKPEPVVHKASPEFIRAVREGYRVRDVDPVRAWSPTAGLTDDDSRDGGAPTRADWTDD